MPRPPPWSPPSSPAYTITALWVLKIPGIGQKYPKFIFSVLTFFRAFRHLRRLPARIRRNAPISICNVADYDVRQETRFRALAGDVPDAITTVDPPIPCLLPKTLIPTYSFFVSIRLSESSRKGFRCFIFFCFFITG